MSTDVNIVIPTYNRDYSIGEAIDAALRQSYTRSVVTVIDDGSTDNTRDEVSRFLYHDRVRYVSLSCNIGTAQAKNTAIALNDCPFITFHDSDDIPDATKIERQICIARQPDIKADSILNWALTDTPPESQLNVDLVLHEHLLVDAQGKSHHMRRALSLVDDLFPNLQMAAGVPGDWILINCGLFRASVFHDLGGFSDCIEEDRELRNRLIFNGRVLWLIPEILMTKYECEDSLTVQCETNYDSDLRRSQRQAIWDSALQFKQGRPPTPVVMDLSTAGFSFVSTPMWVSDALMTQGSRQHLLRELNEKHALKPSERIALCTA